MHPEVRQDKQGSCPKCAMALVLKDEVKSHSLHHTVDDMGLGKTTWKNYMPLLVIIGIILLTSITISLKNNFNLPLTISYFMTGFFLVFSTFKLKDLKGFAKGYFTYDLLAKKWLPYGYIYPFIELFFGLAMISIPQSKPLLLAEFIIMVFSGLGVILKLARKEKFQCVCLGTFLKVPLTKVTLLEDFCMALGAMI